MSEPVRIAVVLRGGMVEAVLSAGVAVEVALIDYDTDGAGEVISVPQAEGPPVRALPVEVFAAEDDIDDRRLVWWAFAHELDHD